MTEKNPNEVSKTAAQEAEDAKRPENMQQKEAEEVQAATGHTVPKEELPEDEMTDQEREQAGLEPVEGEGNEDDSQEDDQEEG